MMLGDVFMRYVIALICMLFASLAWADMRCSTNSLGVTTCKDSDGRVIKSRTNSLGTTTYTDNKGNKVKAPFDKLIQCNDYKQLSSVIIDNLNEFECVCI